MANVFDLRDQEKLEDRLRCSYTAIYDPAYVVIIACLSAKERRDHTRRQNTFSFQRFSVEKRWKKFFCYIFYSLWYIVYKRMRWPTNQRHMMMACSFNLFAPLSALAFLFLFSLCTYYLLQKDIDNDDRLFELACISSSHSRRISGKKKFIFIKYFFFKRTSNLGVSDAYVPFFFHSIYYSYAVYGW
jgi:hypothetical protein